MIFFVEAICMIIELCISRILSPFFGSSNTAWTIVIGFILLANSIGNNIGGKIIDKKIKNGMFLSLLFSNVLLLFSNILNLLLNNNIVNSSLISLIAVLLFIVEIALGTIPPQIMYEHTSKNKTGVQTAKIYKNATLGGLVGTFFGGLVLIKYLSSEIIILICALIICILLLFLINKQQKLCIISLILICITLILIPLELFSESNHKSKNENLNIKIDSMYDRIWVHDTNEVLDGVNDDYKNEPIRLYNTGTFCASGTFIRKDIRNEIVFNYLKKTDEIIKNEKTKDADILMIGGAAYQLPKHILANTNNNIDVVEIDDKSYEIACQYFYLKDCLDEFDSEHKRFNNYIDDGRIFLSKNEKRYDFIINDAFLGETAPPTLSTQEFANIIYNRLNEDGIYIINIITSIDGFNSTRLKDEYKTLQTVFTNVKLIKIENNDDNMKKQNYCLIATNRELKGKYQFKNIDTNKAEVLTDNKTKQ